MNGIIRRSTSFLNEITLTFLSSLPHPIRFVRRNPLLVGVLLLGLFFRLFSISHGVSFHPDERHIVMVTQNLSWADMNPHSFAYGSFPFYFSWAASRALSLLSPELANYDGLFIVGRCLTALFGILGVVVSYLLAKALFASPSVSLLAAALVSLNVFHIQLSRFFTVDMFLTTWCSIALLACVRLAQRGSFRNYIIAGVSLGFAAATKISVASMGLPLLIAFIAAARSEQAPLRRKHYLFAVLCILSAAVTFSILEPYAYLDFATFYRQTKEQTDMVRGLWRPPYTVQYAGTAPYLYVLQQMYSYTMGFPLALAAFGGFIFLWLRQCRTPKAAEIVLLSWITIVFLGFGGLQVKFPRYFLPIYPALFVCAAFALCELGKFLARVRLGFLSAVPTTIVVGWCVVYAAAFSQIYTRDHAYQLATRWIFENIPAQSRILGFGWDDKLPLYLPGLNPRQYQYEGPGWELGLYEPDNDQKLAAVAERLAKADYVVFPTNRIYGSIPRLPQEYVFSTNLLRLLFADKLGYKLVQTIKVRPRLGPLVFDDDLADESFSVYDHPKVSIFRRSENLTAAEISSRILQAYNFGPLPSFEQMMTRDTEGTELPNSAVRSGIFSALWWLVVLEALSLLALPVVGSLVPRSIEHGLGISKAAGPLLFGALAWLLGTFHVLRLTAFNCRLLAAGCVAFALGALLRSGKISSLMRLRAPRVGEILFVLTFFGFLLIRAFQPEIFWGEKPMDFTFLNYFIRLNTLPPEDPWAAGQQMHYYYFGTFLFALLHKITGIDSAIGYNLAIATVAAFSVSAAYTLICSLTRGVASGLIGCLAIILISNLEVLRLIFWGDKKGFDLFWASTRLFHEPGITEYPLWAYLFADLHAHVIALPIALIVLCAAPRFLTSESESLSVSLVLHRILCGVCLGILFLTNTWDFISYGGVLGVLIVYGAVLTLNRRRSSLIGRLGIICSDLLRDLPLLALGILPFVLPFLHASGNKLSPGYGFNQSSEFDRIDQILRHLGQWLFPLALGLIVFAAAAFRSSPKKIGTLSLRLLGAAVLGFIPAAIGFSTVPLARFRPAPPLGTLPWGILGMCSAFAAVAAFVFLGRRVSRNVRVAALFCFCAVSIIATVEICFLIDHMNSIFKFYNAVWVLLGAATAALLPDLFRKLWKASPVGLRFLLTRPLCFLATAVFAVAFAGTLFNVFTMTTFRRVMGPRPTLDGMAYLYWSNPQEAAAINWIREHVSGVPVILEAHGNSYGAFTRISMNTGLPTVLGWDYHVQQRGTSQASIFERSDLIDAVYSAPDPESAVQLLKLGGIDLVYVGRLERELYRSGKYNQAGFRKWDEHPDVFQPLFRSGDSVLYRMSFSRLD